MGEYRSYRVIKVAKQYLTKVQFVYILCINTNTLLNKQTYVIVKLLDVRITEEVVLIEKLYRSVQKGSQVAILRGQTIIHSILYQKHTWKSL